MQTRSLYHLIIRVPKKHAAFTYFILEANEGLCFYSTLSTSLKGSFRDIEVFSPLSLKREVIHLFNQLKSEYTIEIQMEKTIKDREGLGQEF